jgi:type II secretory pathway component PulK
VALVVVLTGLTVLAAFSAEFSYRSRVDVRTASNLEREVQAYFHARSAMEIVRLVVTSQKFVDLATAGMPAARSLELWRFACKFAEVFNTSSLNFLGIELVNMKGTEGVGVDQGGFSCEIVPEDSRINVNVTSATDRKALFTRLYPLLRGQVDTEVKAGEDDRKAAELILNIMDWVDPDDDRTDIDSTGSLVQAGGAGENGSYSRHGYKARNAKMDSVEELRLVEGMTDDLFCRFGRDLTVYNTDKVNVNEADLLLIKALVCDNLAGDPVQVCWRPFDARGSIMDIALMQMESCRTFKRDMFLPAFTSEADFVDFWGRLPELGQFIQVNANTLKPMITTAKSKALRVTSRGWVGESGHEIQAVIETGSTNWVYWKETGFDTTNRQL